MVDDVEKWAGVVNLTQSEIRSYLVEMMGTPLPPCFEHQCENKGVMRFNPGISVKTNDL